VTESRAREPSLVTTCRLAWLPALAVLLLVGCGGSGKPERPAACVGGDLSARFAVVFGSAGAGQIVYRLTLRNTSAAACTVPGIPRLRLLDARGRPLPTRVTRDRPGSPAPRVELAPGASTAATARFSPDVPGVGEPRARRACEPVAHRLRVLLAQSAVVAKVAPPTPVCEHGRLALRPFR
jgi:hypothetical protein